MSEQVSKAGRRKTESSAMDSLSTFCLLPAVHIIALPTCLLRYHLRAVVDVAALARGGRGWLLPADGVLEHLVRVRVRVRVGVKVGVGVGVGVRPRAPRS